MIASFGMKLTDRARALKRDVVAVYLAARDPRAPWYATALAIFVAGYALSPIDLIPDFVPVLGYLDDLILVPLGIAAVVAMLPAEVLADSRSAAAEIIDRPVSRLAAIVIVAIWLASIILVAWIIFGYFAHRRAASGA
jgi:uncharacterized membrane protein YkvA (DUF1232 family)